MRNKEFPIGEHGKLPPQATDLEEQVIATMILEPGRIGEIIRLLPPDAFYREVNKIIFQKLVEMNLAGKGISIETLANCLGNDLDLIGGHYYLVQITGKHTYQLDIHTPCLIILEKSILRKIIEVSARMTYECYEGADPFDAISSVEQFLQSIYELMDNNKQLTFADEVSATFNKIVALKENKQSIIGLPTGLNIVDKITGGRCEGELTIIAARPSMGKTTRVIQEVINLAENNIPVGFISLEMNAFSIIIKMFANQITINSNDLRTGHISDSDLLLLRDIVTKLKNSGICFKDIARININEVINIARLWHKKHGIKALYIDYLQLIHGVKKGVNRDQEIGEISSGLKAIAKELKIPVIALCQLSRAAEAQQRNKRPQLSSLRESGNLEQDADVVSFLYRPEYYGIMQDENGNDLTNIMEEIIAKNRNGSTGRALLWYDRAISKIYPYDRILDAEPAPVIDSVKSNFYEKELDF